VIRLTSEPAYSTFTAPDPVAAADALGELAADELEEEELQPAASPMKASPTTTSRARVDRYVSMMPTLATVTCEAQ
jgi:hypothetical protein